MQAMTIRVPPPRPIVRPRVPLLSFDPVPLDELLEEEQQQQIETASILGDRPGVDGPGLPDGDGAGDGGAAASGLFRNVPPIPLNISFPAVPNSVKGQHVELAVFVDEQGRIVPDMTRLVTPTSDRNFNAYIARLAQEWVFEPGRSGGKVVGSWFQYGWDL
jgi:hypothetical protein